MIFWMFLFLVGAEAQTRATTLVNSGDTLTNADTLSLTAKITNPYAVTTWQVNNKRVSGNSAGKTYFEGSLDNVYFVKIDSATNTNAAMNTHFFSDNPAEYLYYRLRTVTTTTVKATTTGYVILRR